MGMRINTNTAAMNAYRNLSVNDSAMSKSLEKLSSGFRINRAADDAAGLAISEGMKSQIGGLKVAVRNTQDGVSVVQTAEGALATTTSILQRMRDLSVQAANTGGLSSDAKGNIQSEVTQLKAELDRIANTTKFNGKALLDGSYSGQFQVGANATASDKITVTIGTAMSAAGLGVNGVDVTTGGASYSDGPGTVDLAASAATASTITYGGNTYTLDLTGWSTGGKSTDAAKNQSLIQSQLDKQLNGSPISGKIDSFGGVTIAGPTGMTTVGGTGYFGGLTADATPGSDGGTAALATIDAAIKTVSTTRANLGAIQNRLEQTTANLNIAVENLTASNSRIVDVDMASEMTEFSKNQILVQAGTSMLAQANQSAQSVLKLLQ
ncbi:flagellin N-terminal helical domain-containing protein [Klenkia brasiliensis]|uniref:Flagellin n=1 Tax=Klenkia brasiliensis TaxID=333142 RepID=A0A1G7LIN2_9ACTN|nr:flagellin [Klenkia brasiliensis]SDF49214.1 flagellin [Klenkia brasiliensis]